MHSARNTKPKELQRFHKKSALNEHIAQSSQMNFNRRRHTSKAEDSSNSKLKNKVSNSMGKQVGCRTYYGQVYFQ